MKWVILFLFLVAILILNQDKLGTALREIKANNPMGIRDFSNTPWVGKQGLDDKNFVIFDTVEHGIRAGCINLIHKQTKYGAKNLQEIFNGYTTDYENPDKYAQNIDIYTLEITSIYQPIDLRNFDLLKRICLGVIRNEIGINPYSNETIEAGVQLALNEA